MLKEVYEILDTKGNCQPSSKEHADHIYIYPSRIHLFLVQL
jgi:hypothetical protein